MTGRTPPGKYADYVPRDATRFRRPVTDQHPRLTTSNNGGGGVEFEEIADLSPSTDVLYEIRESAGLRIQELGLFDSGGNELAGDAQLRFEAEPPSEDESKPITREYTYNEFKNLELRNRDEEKEIEFKVDGDEVYVPEDHHWKLKMKHDTDVDWSQAGTTLEYEVFEWS